MPNPDRSQALDHVVVLMFENRSFDNLLGRLYEPGEVPSFEGVTGKDLTNPIPDWAVDRGNVAGNVPYGVAAGLNTPSPDPGEEYQHVNTQLFGIIDPPANRGVLASAMVAPYNVPPDPRQRPQMNGFVADYISSFTAEMGRPPRYDEYAQIMTGFAPDQLPVVSALARGFATFDHWFCEVPSQTFANRSFFHAASSSGFVDNMPPESFPLRNTAETIFERLDARGLTWRVYCDPPSHMSLTGVIHGPRLWPYFGSRFVSTDQFLDDCADGNLPAYSFIEPNLLYGHNDMHPAFDALFPGSPIDPPSSMLGGEALLAKIYNAVRSAASDRGSNAWNTLLLITFDEHGGTYDHVPPPLVPPPSMQRPPGGSSGQLGFGFDRSGLRVPAFAISAWIPEQTVVTAEYRHTAVIATLREHWQLGGALTRRDFAAADLSPVLSLAEPRDPDSWPEVKARQVPPYTGEIPAPGAALRGLCKAAFRAVVALAEHHGKSSPALVSDENLTRAEGLALLDDLSADLFVRLRDS
jgi:phospholipase C